MNSNEAAMGGEGRSASLNYWNLSYIYLRYFVCLCVIVCVCVSQFVSERSAILLVLVIKLTKETRRRIWRGRDRKGADRRGRV